MSDEKPKDAHMNPNDQPPRHNADNQSKDDDELVNKEQPPDGDSGDGNNPSKNKTWSAAAGTWVKENPRTAATIGAGAILCAAPVLATAPALAAAGFGAQGVGAGTAAAAWQASIGNAVAPSLFATLQSAGAAGYGAAAVNGVASAAGGATAAAGFFKAALGSRKKKKKEKGEEASNGNDEDKGATQEKEKSEDEGKNEEMGSDDVARSRI